MKVLNAIGVALMLGAMIIFMGFAGAYSNGSMEDMEFVKCMVNCMICIVSGYMMFSVKVVRR